MFIYAREREEEKDIFSLFKCLYMQERQREKTYMSTCVAVDLRQPSIRVLVEAEAVAPDDKVQHDCRHGETL